jgi:hypothetical protein
MSRATTEGAEPVILFLRLRNKEKQIIEEVTGFAISPVHLRAERRCTKLEMQLKSLLVLLLTSMAYHLTFLGLNFFSDKMELRPHTSEGH